MNIFYLVTVIVQPEKVLKICFYKTSKGSINIYNSTWTKVIFSIHCGNQKVPLTAVGLCSLYRFIKGR